MEDKRERFLKNYAEVPEGLRSDIIAVISGKTYTWDTAYLEIKDDTELGKKILKTLVVVGII